MKQVTMYEACDGTLFSNHEGATRHDAILAIDHFYCQKATTDLTYIQRKAVMGFIVDNIKFIDKLIQEARE